MVGFVGVLYYKVEMSYCIMTRMYHDQEYKPLYQFLWTRSLPWPTFLKGGKLLDSSNQTFHYYVGSQNTTRLASHSRPI